MPIARPTLPGPLRQGDILKDLIFYVTGEAGAIAEAEVPFCVMLSRDCNALRSPNVLVAEIQCYRPEAFTAILSGEMSLDQTRRTMDSLRDGDGTPDTCYLGPLLDGEQRYAVSLDRIHTVEVPEGDARSAWIEKHRVFQLDADFIRHLQTRLFSSVAKQGFNDFTWWPTQDLEALVIVGEKDIGNLTTEHAKAGLTLKKAEQQQNVNSKRIEGLQNKRNKEAGNVEEARELLAAYQTELDRRKGGAAKSG